MTRTEAATQALYNVIDKALPPKGTPRINRNAVLDDLLQGIAEDYNKLETAKQGGAYINLVDGETEILDEAAGADVEPAIEGYELEQSCDIELFVCKADQRERDAVTDSFLEMIAAAIEEDRTLGGVVSHCRLRAPARDTYPIEGAPPVKTVMLPVVMTLSSSRPF